MRKVVTSMLKPGTRVARSVYNCDGQVLLSAGKVLTPSYIKRLIVLGVPAIYVEDGLFKDIGADDIISEGTRQQARQLVKKMHTSVGLAAGSEVDLDTDVALQTVDLILNEVLASKSLVVNLCDIRTSDDYTFAHSVNVCVLGLLTGVTMGFNHDRLIQMGLGALLHDIGKVNVPPEILNKPGKLTEAEFAEIKKHCEYGFEILRHQKEVSTTAAHVAYQHHERFNGEGYPRGLKGDQIHEYARIVGMVDVFDAMVSDRVYRKAFAPNEAVEMITGSGNFHFEFRIVQAFIHNVAAYPAGTIVELTNGEMGVVIGTPRGSCSRPDVRVFAVGGEVLNRVEERRLSQETNLVIKRVVPENELPVMGMENLSKV